VTPVTDTSFTRTGRLGTSASGWTTGGGATPGETSGTAGGRMRGTGEPCGTPPVAGSVCAPTGVANAAHAARSAIARVTPGRWGRGRVTAPARHAPIRAIHLQGHGWPSEIERRQLVCSLPGRSIPAVVSPPVFPAPVRCDERAGAFDAVEEAESGLGATPPP